MSHPLLAWYCLLKALEILLEDLEKGFAKLEEDLVDFTSSESWVRALEGLVGGAGRVGGGGRGGEVGDRDVSAPRLGSRGRKGGLGLCRMG